MSHLWLADEGIIADCGDGLGGHVAGALDGPLIVLFEQQRADETNDGLIGGEDAVAMKAEPTCRPLLPACASALRMKCTQGLLKKAVFDQATAVQVRLDGRGNAGRSGSREAHQGLLPASAEGLIVTSEELVSNAGNG